MELNPYKIGQILVKGGYKRFKGKTSHARFKKDGCPIIVISEHKGRSIDRNTYCHIMKKIDLPDHLRAKL